MGLLDHLYHLDWAAKYPLCYYYNDGRHIIFDKYEIDMFGGIYNKKSDQRLSYSKGCEYDKATVYDSSGKRCSIFVARAVVSTFHGPPPTINHSTEHIDCNNKDNNIVCELTWIDFTGQKNNRCMPEEYLSAYIIVRDNYEMTAKEWVKDFDNEKNLYGREYTEGMISMYARRKQHGFSYKNYDDLPDETWYNVVNSGNKMSHWEISDHNRIARVSECARNVIDATRFGYWGNYPSIKINGKNRQLHIVAFEAYYPEAYAAIKSDEMILHKFDDKLDFRPHVLRIGTHSDNRIDAHNNGKYDGTKSAMMKCASYINNVFEKHYKSQKDAVDYLRSNGYLKASRGNISKALSSTTVLVKYNRTWIKQ